MAQNPDVATGTLTHVILDLSGYAALLEAGGAVGAAKVLRPFERIVRAALPRATAEVDHRGDEFHLVFRNPAEAVSATIAIADALQRHNGRHPDLKLSVRFGIEAGQTTRRKGAFMGNAISVASRLVSRGQPGQILVGDGVAALLRTNKAVPLRDLGAWKPKGLAAVHVYEARGPDPTADGSREAERQLATAFHTDVVQSTATAAKLGQRGWRGMFERYHEIVREELRRHDGVEVDTAGDGFYATFSVPSRAIDCAIDMRDRLRRELSIEVRTGIHTGECEVVAGKPGGMAIVIGGRVKDRAGAGDVLVSRTVMDLLTGGTFTFESRGAAVLKGVPGEWALFAVSKIVEAGQLTHA